MRKLRGEVIDSLESAFPRGSRVELLRMDDPEAPPIGTSGTVIGVDDYGTIHVNWDDGSRLGVAYGEDTCRRIDARSPS